MMLLPKLIADLLKWVSFILKRNNGIFLRNVHDKKFSCVNHTWWPTVHCTLLTADSIVYEARRPKTQCFYLQLAAQE